MHALQTAFFILLPLLAFCGALYIGTAAADHAERKEDEQKKNRSVRAAINNDLHIM